MSESLLRITSGLLTTSLGRYHEMMTQQQPDLQQTCRTCSCITKQQIFSFAAEQVTTLLWPSSVLQGHINLHPQLTKDWINWDIGHPALLTYVFTSSTVSWFLIMQLHLWPETSAETILIFQTHCCQELLNS